jgi:hypothetical protein
VARVLGTRGRFFVAYLVLGALVGTGIGLFIVLLERKGPTPPPPWSAWRPSADSVAGQAEEIATHVGRAYRLPSGDQLVRIVIGPPGRAQGNLRAIGITRIVQPNDLGDFESLFDPKQSVMYVLCGGVGRTCKIKGKPSVARGTVLRREALELALYTFEYSKAIEHVVVFFPPGPKQRTLKFALFFHRNELAAQLERPLHVTLPDSRPPLPGRIDPGEKETVDKLTGPRIYRYLGVAKAGDFGDLVVLSPAG